MNFSEAYENYYAILNSSYRTNDMIINDLPTSSDESLVTEMNELIATFLNMIDILRKYERSKESNYLQLWLGKLDKAITENGQSLRHLLEPLVLGENPNFTQAFQIVELWRQGFINEVNSLQQIYDDWQQQYTQFANITIMKSAREAVKSLGDNIVNITPNELVKTILERIQLDWEKKNGKIENTNFYKFMNEFSPYLTKIIKDMKDVRDVWDKGVDLKTTFKIENQKELNKTVMSKIVDGLVNGLSQEIMLVAFGSGASTARATRVLKFIDDKKMEVATETDVYAVLNGDLTPNQKAVEKIKNFEKDSDIQQLITSSDLDNNFILHYSSKDLTVAESKSSSGAAAKIKGEGGFGSKIPALQAMGNAAGQPDAVHNLIFKAINVGKDLIYDNNTQLINQISTSITALTFSFMFDDFERQFEQIRGNLNSNNTEINLYAISGNYYPASDVLTTLYNYVDSLAKGNKIKSFINVGFKPSKKSAWDIYIDKKKTKYGSDLWKEVRNTVAAETKMQVRMSTNYLRNLTFAIQNRKQ